MADKKIPKTASKKKRNEDAETTFESSSCRIWDEARKEIIPLTIGTMAALASTFVNHSLPRLVRNFMDPSKGGGKSKEGNNNDSCSERKFIIQILWLSLAGGTLTFTRTWLMNRAQDSIATRLRKEIFESLLTKRELEWFQTVEIEETSSGNNSDEKMKIEDDNSKEESDDSSITTTIAGDDSKDIEETGEKPAKSTALLSSSSSNTTTGITPAAVGVIMRDDVDVVASTVTNTIANLFRSSSSCLFGLYNMLRISPPLVGLSVVVAPVAGTLAWTTKKHLEKIVALQQRAAMRSASFVEERLNHIAMVKTCYREHDEVEAHNQIQDECFSLGGKAALASGLSGGILFGASSTAFSGILLAGRMAVEAGVMTPGQLTSFGTYAFMLAHGTAGLVRAFGEYSKGMQCAARLYKLIDNNDDDGSNNTNNGDGEKKQEEVPCDSEPQTKDNVLSVDTDQIQKLSIENVCFSYQTEPTKSVLLDLSFSLSRGEVVALVGANGSGKSTTASILAGMYHPRSGEIALYAQNDDADASSSVEKKPSASKHNIADIERGDRVNLIQLVPQVPAIFDASVLDNVRYGRPGASDEDVRNATKAANCDGFVSKLPGGFGYRAGRNGSRLTGGQRQRIGLARAFLVDPVFLVLDEPTSAMDAEGERALRDATAACRASDRGLLIITHCTKSLDLVDRVLVLEDGKIKKEETGRGNPGR